jgi:hypothetical protein
MKSRSIDNTEGKNHPVKANIQEDIWNAVKAHDLEAETTGEKINEVFHEKPGQVNMIYPFVYEKALVVRPAAWPVMLVETK